MNYPFKHVLMSKQDTYCDDCIVIPSHLVLTSLPDNREEDAKKLKGLDDKTPNKISDWNFFISEISNDDFQVQT